MNTILKFKQAFLVSILMIDATVSSEAWTSVFSFCNISVHVSKYVINESSMELSMC